MISNTICKHFVDGVNLFLIFAEQKKKLSEEEQQAKKAEAAQKRRMQVERAARESEVCSCFTLFCFIYLSCPFGAGSDWPKFTG